MAANYAQHWNLEWMIAAVFLIVYLGSPRQRGQIAWRRVKRLLEQSLDRRRYTQFHDLTLPTGGGSERLDHVLVSRFGVVILASEHRPGKLSGGEAQEFWKQTHLGRAHRWPNPLHNIRLQMETLQNLLDIPRDRIHLAVILTGQESPLPKLPHQVLPLDRMLPFLRSKNDQLLTPEQADKVVEMINQKRLVTRPGISKQVVAQFALGLAVLAGLYFVYRDDIGDLLSDFDQRVERLAAPERFDTQGERKTEQQLFEESLVCAFSEDNMRCACYEKRGEKVEIEFSRCQDLAEQGSILKQ